VIEKRDSNGNEGTGEGKKQALKIVACLRLVFIRNEGPVIGRLKETVTYQLRLMPGSDCLPTFEHFREQLVTEHRRILLPF